MGRGDRRLGAVLRRAWELGACNEAWWEGTDVAFSAWDAAIAESGLGWKYRQVADGEWNVMSRAGDKTMRGQARRHPSCLVTPGWKPACIAAYVPGTRCSLAAFQGGGGKGRLDRGAIRDRRLDAPLPWDVVDTGISRAWLKADLQRALEGATVPDCSHTVCSECGVVRISRCLMQCRCCTILYPSVSCSFCSVETSSGITWLCRLLKFLRCCRRQALTVLECSGYDFASRNPAMRCSWGTWTSCVALNVHCDGLTYPSRRHA